MSDDDLRKRLAELEAKTTAMSFVIRAILEQFAKSGNGQAVIAISSIAGEALGDAAEQNPDLEPAQAAMSEIFTR